MNRPPVSDHHSKIAGPVREVGLAVVNYHDGYVTCSCNWVFAHKREKVREDAIDRHLNKAHAGRGLRV